MLPSTALLVGDPCLDEKALLNIASQRRFTATVGAMAQSIRLV